MKNAVNCVYSLRVLKSDDPARYESQIELRADALRSETNRTFDSSGDNGAQARTPSGASEHLGNFG